MSPRPPPALEDSLREMFPEEWLRQTARETGLIVRKRKIDHVIIFWVLTPGFYKNQMFAKVEENGGSFVSKIKKNMDPILDSVEEGLSKTKSNR